MVISFCNEKGGCGKSTLALFLSGRLAEDGDDVLLIDADPQNSTSVFVESRNKAELKQTFSTISKNGDTLKNEIKAMNKKFDCLVVDTGGRDTIEMRHALLASDIVIIPVIPSSFDERVLTYMLQTLKNASEFNEGIKGIILPSKITTNPLLKEKEIQDFKKTIEELKEKENLENLYIAESVISDRKAYRDSIRGGKTLKEFSEGKKEDKAYLEFESFFNELIEIAKA